MEHFADAKKKKKKNTILILIHSKKGFQKVADTAPCKKNLPVTSAHLFVCSGKTAAEVKFSIYTVCVCVCVSPC